MSTEKTSSFKNSLSSHLVALNQNNELLIEQLQQIIAVIETDLIDAEASASPQLSVTLYNQTTAAQVKAKQQHQLSIHTFSLVGDQDSLTNFMFAIDVTEPKEREANLGIKKCIFRAITQSGSVLSALEDLLETLPTELTTINDSVLLLQSALELLNCLQTDYQALYALHRVTNETPLIHSQQQLMH